MAGVAHRPDHYAERVWRHGCWWAKVHMCGIKCSIKCCRGRQEKQIAVWELLKWVDSFKVTLCSWLWSILQHAKFMFLWALIIFIFIFMFQATAHGLGWSLQITIITIQLWCVSATCCSPTHRRDAQHLHMPHSTTHHQVNTEFLIKLYLFNWAAFFSFSEPLVNSLARRRWMLFYTLVKNPHLILLRKHHLSSSHSEQTLTSPQSDTVLQAWALTSQAQCHKATPQSCPEAKAIPAEEE